MAFHEPPEYSLVIINCPYPITNVLLGGSGLWPIIILRIMISRRRAINTKYILAIYNTSRVQIGTRALLLRSILGNWTVDARKATKRNHAHESKFILESESNILLLLIAYSYRPCTPVGIRKVNSCETVTNTCLTPPTLYLCLVDKMGGGGYG